MLPKFELLEIIMRPRAVDTHRSSPPPVDQKPPTLKEKIFPTVVRDLVPQLLTPVTAFLEIQALGKGRDETDLLNIKHEFTYDPNAPHAQIRYTGVQTRKDTGAFWEEVTYERSPQTVLLNAERRFFFFNSAHTNDVAIAQAHIGGLLEDTLGDSAELLKENGAYPYAAVGLSIDPAHNDITLTLTQPSLTPRSLRLDEKGQFELQLPNNVYFYFAVNAVDLRPIAEFLAEPTEQT